MATRMATTFHNRYQCWVGEMTHRERAPRFSKGLPALVRVIRQHLR